MISEQKDVIIMFGDISALIYCYLTEPIMLVVLVTFVYVHRRVINDL